MQRMYKDLFIELIRIATGNLSGFKATPTKEEWTWLYEQAGKHAIIGPLFTALDKIPAEQRPPRQLLMDWHATCEAIKADCRKANHDAVWASKKFVQAGFRNAVLKGQGNALLYPEPLLRQSGDVDIWLDGKRKDIIGYVRKFFPNIRVQWIEVEFPIKKDCCIEVHTMPSFMSNPFDNKRLIHYFEEKRESIFTNTISIQDEGEMRVPTTEVNLVFQLSHIYRHLFNEGIGLRQLMDYYYLLLTTNETARHNATCKIKELNMQNICQAVMWIMQQVFGLKEELLLMTPDATKGEYLLEEILLAGNFGQHDERNQFKSTKWGNFWQITGRNWRFLRHYPREVLWNPYYRIAQYVWRRYNGYQ